jgi:hypothetical protein
MCVFSPLPSLLYVLTLLQIARDCPEGREPVEEEDNTWGETQDNPWASGAQHARREVTLVIRQMVKLDEG